jgi:hypothetical protein
MEVIWALSKKKLNVAFDLKDVTMALPARADHDTDYKIW